MEMLDNHGHSSLFGTFLNYDRKKFYYIQTRHQSYKTFFSWSLMERPNKLGHFQTGVILAGKNRSLPYHEKCSTKLGYGLIFKF